MTADKAHILVVDDDRRLRDLLRRYLGENGFVVTTARDAADARAKMQSLCFDLLVLDVMMPGEDGLSLTRSLRQNSDLPILLLTARGAPDDRIAGFEGGADDYMPKPFDPRELVLRIESILRRLPQDASVTPPLHLGRFRLDLQRGELTAPDTHIPLTASETKLLSLLAIQPGEIISREDLANSMGLGENLRSIDVQITRLRRKIEDDPKQPRFIQTVRGAGYVLRPEASTERHGHA